jgi:putative membrane protein
VRALDWGFLIPLLVGIGIAVVTLASVIEHLLETQPVRMAALFFGLVGGSVVVAARLVQGWNTRRIAITAVVAVVAFFVLGQRSGPVQDPSLVMYLAAGSIAICAMILPGVSGSFLLLMLGMYDNVLGAVTARDLVVVAVFMVGCVIGLALFSRALHWGLVHHEYTLLAALIGLMLGSLRVLWPWPDGTESTALATPSGDVVVPVVIALLGFAAVVVVTIVGERLTHRTDAELAADLGSP